MAVTFINRSYRYRFYPTDDQAAELLRTFGCVRKVYNLALEARHTAWRTNGRHLGYQETSRLLTAWKKTAEFGYLAEVSSVPLQQALRHLEAAFTSFWQKRSSYPRFKTKHRSRRSAEYTRSGFRWRNGQLLLAKMKQPLQIVWSRPLPPGSGPSTVTVSLDFAGRWFVSLVVLSPNIQPPRAVNAAIAVDLGITWFATLSDGEKVANPRFYRRERSKLVAAQRKLSRKQISSKNYAKAKIKIGKIHARIRDRRRDFLHKTSTRLARENQTVIVEDLAVRNMVKNHALAQAISNAAWSEFRSMLDYKCRWYGRDFMVIDRWRPTSKTCSTCGHVQTAMTLQVRHWKCAVCGSFHDRDVNAARNILAAGLTVIACGGDVRP